MYYRVVKWLPQSSMVQKCQSQILYTGLWVPTLLFLLLDIPNSSLNPKAFSVWTVHLDLDLGTYPVFLTSKFLSVLVLSPYENGMLGYLSLSSPTWMMVPHILLTQFMPTVKLWPRTAIGKLCREVPQHPLPTLGIVVVVVSFCPCWELPKAFKREAQRKCPLLNYKGLIISS